ncbi:hypothetical protein WSM22_44380 [Cytophagales bacterium WSM2-2]|nr:hypothetical protein WSM22_44380 [Cytophagales bacterium WSM2-2]
MSKLLFTRLYDLPIRMHHLPQLVCTRKSDRLIDIHYESNRRMIDVGVGIIKAIAKIKNDEIEISQIEETNGSTTLSILLKKVN